MVLFLYAVCPHRSGEFIAIACPRACGPEACLLRLCCRFWHRALVLASRVPGSFSGVSAPLGVTDSSASYACSGLCKGRERRGLRTAKEATMNTHIPTIHDLNRKNVSELRVIFRHAASLATSEQRPECERKAAQQTCENIRRCLAVKVPHP